MGNNESQFSKDKINVFQSQTNQQMLKDSISASKCQLPINPNNFNYKLLDKIVRHSGNTLDDSKENRRHDINLNHQALTEYKKNTTLSTSHSQINSKLQTNQSCLNLPLQIDRRSAKSLHETKQSDYQHKQVSLEIQEENIDETLKFILENCTQVQSKTENEFSPSKFKSIKGKSSDSTDCSRCTNTPGTAHFNQQDSNMKGKFSVVSPPDKRVLRKINFEESQIPSERQFQNPNKNNMQQSLTQLIQSIDHLYSQCQIEKTNNMDFRRKVETQPRQNLFFYKPFKDPQDLLEPSEQMFPEEQYVRRSTEYRKTIHQQSLQDALERKKINAILEKHEHKINIDNPSEIMDPLSISYSQGRIDLRQLNKQYSCQFKKKKESSISPRPQKFYWKIRETDRSRRSKSKI